MSNTTAANNYWAALPLGKGARLLSHDENGVAALTKPAGLLSHPNEPGDEPRSLLNARYTAEGEFYEWTDSGGAVRRLWLLNRIDSATSGVVLAASTEALAVEVKTQFRRKQVRKVYHALVFGRPKAVVELWRDMLTVQKAGGRIRTSAAAGRIAAECRMSVVRMSQSAPAVTLVKLEPRTGRSHQLRVQCAKRSLPIVGDQTYGDFGANRAFAKMAGTKRLFLHSTETAFDYEWGGRTQRFAARAEMPPEFAAQV